MTTSPLCMATAAMGTRFELVVYGEDAERLRPAGEAALEEIEAWHRRLSRFAPDSLLSHINRTAAERPVRLDAGTFALFEDAARVHRASGGAFDITVAPLMAAWGFPPSAAATNGGAPHEDGEADDVALRNHLQSPAAGVLPPPDADPRISLAPRTAMDAIELDAGRRTIHFLRPGVSLDLGAIAKGHALDLAAAMLREAGVQSALLHGGTSSVVAIGTPPNCDAWRVALGPEDDAPVASLRDRTLSVSSPRGRTAVAQPATGTAEGAPAEHGHIIDPRTGAPAPDRALAAVIGPSARLGDAWATAIAVLGHRPAALTDDWITFIR